MLQHELPLNQMSAVEKLAIINQIWDNLLQESDDIPLPEWHKTVLSERAERVASGKAQFKLLSEARQELQAKYR